ncbi:patatin-like phospholipase family protein [Streptomyces mirabilis]|uniref:patatin-like phospholipase family protein n=1 Tax=Streptomyces mirabilis TaxID=68239 RepID=UPI0036AB2730
MTTTATPAAETEPEGPHPVWRVLTERAQADSRPGARADGYRVALAIEGGGMRGIIAGGMALALHELGLTNGFDAVYGASAGAASGAWLLSSSPQSLRFWAHPRYARTAIRHSNPLRGRPLVDLYAFYEVLYRYGDQDFAPMDFASILAGDIEYHPLATDAATGESTDLRPFIGDAAELRLALRASAALPLLAGDPVMSWCCDPGVRSTRRAPRAPPRSSPGLCCAVSPRPCAGCSSTARHAWPKTTPPWPTTRRSSRSAPPRAHRRSAAWLARATSSKPHCKPGAPPSTRLTAT